MEKRYICNNLMIYPKYLFTMFFVSFALILSFYLVNNLLFFVVYFLTTAYGLKKLIEYLQKKLTSFLTIFDEHIEIEFPLFISFFNISKTTEIIFYNEIVDVYIFDNYTKIFKIETKSKEYTFGVPFDETTNSEIINFIKIKKI